MYEAELNILYEVEITGAVKDQSIIVLSLELYHAE
jgi:hypothetical protein